MLSIEDRDRVRWLTINRPHRKNAIPPEGWSQLADAFADFETSEARVLVVTGTGGDFCSGADLAGEDGSIRPPTGVMERYTGMKNVESAALALHRITKPTIAAVDGVAVGAGLNLALGCDVVVASSRARFSEIFVRRGLTLDFGGTWLLPRHVGLQRAKELALSGRVVEAGEALAIGLVLEVVPPDDLRNAADAMAGRFLQGAPVAQMFAKRGLSVSMEMSFAEALAFEGQAQAICLSSADAIEGVSAFLEKRDPDFAGR